MKQKRYTCIYCIYNDGVWIEWFQNASDIHVKATCIKEQILYLNLVFEISVSNSVNITIITVGLDIRMN